MSVAAILWALPFCISLCSVDLVGSVVEHGLVFDFDDDGTEGKENLCVRSSRLVDTKIFL